MLRKLFLLGLLLPLLMPVPLAEARELYRDGRFVVRKVGEVCKLDIYFYHSDEESSPQAKQEAAAILSLFDSHHFAELFTERERIGLARDQAWIKFDRQPTQRIPFITNEDGKDDYWRWQYLSSSEGLLEGVRRRNTMGLSFSNGQRQFRFSISLAGSGKAVSVLKSCH